MAIPGIIEDYNGWIAVADPTYQQPKHPTLLRRLRKFTPQPSNPPKIYATDFTTPEVSTYANRLVTAATTILNSDTITTGMLGNTYHITQQILTHTYNTLHAMRHADRTIAHLDDLNLPTNNPQQHALATQAANTLKDHVINPTHTMEQLATDVTTRDLTHNHHTPDPASATTLDALTARLHALNELEQPTHT